MNGITVTVDTTPQHAEELTRAALAGEGFGILTEIDVSAIFAAKLDVHRSALKILGACNPMLAHTAIGHDPSVALLLPCTSSSNKATTASRSPPPTPAISSTATASTSSPLTPPPGGNAPATRSAAMTASPA